MTGLEHTQLRPFAQNDLASLVDFWNNAFSDKQNFYPITADDFRRRVLDCEAFDPDGLILAWHTDAQGKEQIVGLVHAFRPAPKHGLYLRWEQRHDLALLYVAPEHRRRGVGTRLLRAAENWLYYCPVYVGGATAPCYGTIEGPRPPFFGSTQRLGISIHERTLINFLANRGYRVADPGDVSFHLTLDSRTAPILPALDALGLRLVPFSHEKPFDGTEPKGREEYTLYGNNHGDPYVGYALVTDANLLQGHISWYPMRQAERAAIAGFWIAPTLRGHGLGRYLLDRALYDQQHAPPPWGGYRTVEVQTHWVKHAQAASLYQRRGFEVKMAWVNMGKECAVRGVDVQGSTSSIQLQA